MNSLQFVIMVVFLLIAASLSVLCLVAILRVRNDFRRKSGELEGTLSNVYRIVAARSRDAIDLDAALKAVDQMLEEQVGNGSSPKPDNHPDNVAFRLINETGLSRFIDAGSRARTQLTLANLVRAKNIPAAKKFIATMVREFSY